MAVHLVGAKLITFEMFRDEMLVAEIRRQYKLYAPVRSQQLAFDFEPNEICRRTWCTVNFCAKDRPPRRHQRQR